MFVELEDGPAMFVETGVDELPHPSSDIRQLSSWEVLLSRSVGMRRKQQKSLTKSE